MDKLALPLLPMAPADAGSYTDFAALARLKVEAQERSPEALEKVARQFEALFLEMMLKGMREARLGEGMFDSDAGKFYESMFDKQIATELAHGQGKGLGIAELLMRQLAAQAPGAPPAVEGAAATGGAQAWRPASPGEFVREILPHARKAAAELGVHPLGLVAQAAVETGWGKHVVPGAAGGSSFNLFGIKVGEQWNGAKVAARTMEVEGGLPVPRQASFRSYGSLAESFQDYVRLIASSPRYQAVREQGGTVEGFADAMGRSGYATDPEYSSKIKGIWGGSTLREAMATLKTPDLAPMNWTIPEA